MKAMEKDCVINGFAVHAVYSDESVEQIFKPLLVKLLELQRAKGRRIVVLLAAPPAAGKSTLVNFLTQLAGEKGKWTALGMDGFHLKCEYLKKHFTMLDGEKVPLTAVKGAPETYDVERLSKCIADVAAEREVYWPVYDRTLHEPVDGTEPVSGDIVFIEGNYLLLDADGYRDLRKTADYTIMIRADEADLRERLIERKTKGYGSREQAEIFVEKSDMKNVRLVLERSMAADLTLRMGGDGSYHAEAGKI